MTTQMRDSVTLIEQPLVAGAPSGEPVERRRTNIRELLVFSVLGFACLLPILSIVVVLAGWFAAVSVIGISGSVGVVAALMGVQSDRRRHAKFRRERRLLLLHDSEATPPERMRA